MATAAKKGPTGVLITVEGQWRCTSCGRVSPTTSICSGADDDGNPRCGRTVCERCASRCMRCGSLLCEECFGRAKEGVLCLRCPAPPGGRQAYRNRQRARAATAGAPGSDIDWRTDSDRAYQAAADAQRSVDDANRRVEEIERSIREMQERMRRSSSSRP